jgi:FlaG/FlaF family flagellin (archaellin)
MRNITKFKRSIQAISPVISVLLMIAIAVVASIVAYAWVTGYIGSQTNKTGNGIDLQSFSTQSNLVIYVQNTGQGLVHLKQDSSVYVNNNLKNILRADGADVAAGALIPLNQGKTIELTIDYIPQANEQLTIKVVTVEGTTISANGHPSGGSSDTSGSGSPSYASISYAVSPPGSGSTSPSGININYLVGFVQLITATKADDSFTFSSWTFTGPIQINNITSASSTISITGTGSGTVTANFVSSSNPKLAFLNGNQQINVNAPSQALTIQRQDASGTARTTGGSLTVTLAVSGSTTGSFYSDAACTASITSATIADTASSVVVYYKDSTAGTPTLTASAIGYSSVATTFTIKSLTPTPTPTSNPSNGPTPTANPSNGPTPTTNPSNGPTPTAAPTNGPTPTSTPTNGPTPTPVPQPLTILNVGYEGNWDDTASAWDRSTDQHHTGTASMKSSDGSEGVFTSNDINAQGASSITVSFWYRLDDTDSGDFQVKLYNGANYNTLTTLGDDSTSSEDIWIQYTTTITEAQYMKSNFRIQFTTTLGSGENAWIDDVQITVNGGAGATITDGFEMDDWEINWSIWPNPPWGYATDYAHTGITSAKSDNTNYGPFTCDAKDATGATSVQVTFWYRLQGTNMQPGDFTLYYSGQSGDNPTFTPVQNSNLGGNAKGTWQQASFTITDPAAMTNSFRFRFYSTLGTGEAVWVDDVQLIATRP